MHPAAQRLRSALTRRPWLAPLGFALLAAVVLLVRLGDPGRIMFDETYYVGDARSYLQTGVEPGFAVHPTLGKWLIAAAMWVVGDTPFGWRLSGALAGVGVVVLTHLLARRLLADTREGWWLALVAPVLLLADGLFLTQARIAMLDIHLALFAVAGLYVLVVDRQRRSGDDRQRHRADDRQRRDAGGDRQRTGSGLLVLAGVLFGLAIAVKWSGLLALGGAGLLVLGWELGDARDRGWRGLGGRLGAVALSLVVVPAVVYGATWTPWLVNYADTFTAGCEEGATCEYGAGERLTGLLRHHDQMLDFHLGLEATHTYRSDPMGWPVLQRPVVYHWSTCSAEDATASPTIDPETGTLAPVCDVPEGQAAEVLGLGNPALWWGFLLLTPLLVAGTVLRDRRSAVPLVTWLATWLPWLAVSRTAFLFYMVPAVPLMAIGTAVAVGRLGAPAPVRRTYLGAVLGAAVPLAVLGGLVWLGVVDGLRWVVGAAAVGWALGAAIGAVADHRAAPPPTDTDGVRTTGRWAALVVVLVLATAAWFAPVWLAIPIDGETIRTRWWFETWI